MEQARCGFKPRLPIDVMAVMCCLMNGSLSHRRLRWPAWLAVLALLLNLVGHVSHASALSAAEPHEAGIVLVICGPDGLKRVLWTPDGFESLPDEPGQVKKPCPLCGVLASGLLAPETHVVEAPLQQPLHISAWGGERLPCCPVSAETPPARAPPLA